MMGCGLELLKRAVRRGAACGCGCGARAVSCSSPHRLPRAAPACADGAALPAAELIERRHELCRARGRNISKWLIAWIRP